MPVCHQDGQRGPETSDYQVQHGRHQAPPRGRRVRRSVPTHPTSASLYASWFKVVSGGGGCHWQGMPPYHSTSFVTNQGSLGFPRQPGHCHAFGSLMSGIFRLRAGKFTVPCESGFDPSSNLSWGDLAMDVPGQPSVMSVRLKVSKTDPFRKALHFSSALPCAQCRPCCPTC